MQLLQNGPVGVFVGLWNVDFPSLQSSFHAATGRLPSVAAGRMAFALSLEGAVATIDAACASSLVALAVALDCGGSALVAGVNAICSQLIHQSFFGSGMLSPDGRCKTFDERADGYGRSEACLVLCVTPVADSKHPRVLSCTVSHGGRSSGLTAPSQDGQERVIQSALEKAKVESLEHLEAHGTGLKMRKTGLFLLVLNTFFFCFEKELDWAIRLKLLRFNQCSRRHPCLWLFPPSKQVRGIRNQLQA